MTENGTPRTWKTITPTCWLASDERVIIRTRRTRIGRNGWRAAGYELFTDKNGPRLGFFAKLTDAKNAK